MLPLLLTAAALWTTNDHKSELSANRPPQVVSTSPRPGSAIAPGPFMLSVTFDRLMMEGSYSFAKRSAETYPQCARSAALSRDRRTFTMRCTALAGRAYEIWFNSPPYMNFKNAFGVPARPFQLQFTSRAR